MSDPAALNNENFDNMTVAEFEERLPDLVQSGQGKMTEDPRFKAFFAENPDCAALVSDLEAIAKAARDLFNPIDEPGDEPTEEVGSNDKMWNEIANKLKNEPKSLNEPNDTFE